MSTINIHSGKLGTLTGYLPQQAKVKTADAAKSCGRKTVKLIVRQKYFRKYLRHNFGDTPVMCCINTS
jgi:hypothetical protein